MLIIYILVPRSPRSSPRAAIYLLAAIVAASLAYDLLRMPVQLFDSLPELLDVQKSPSVRSTFVSALGTGGYLRPLRLAQIKSVFDVAHGHYWLAYRGLHALLLTAALFLFVAALNVRRWRDFAAGAFAVTVLTGLHTFGGTVREAFPINHFLEMVVFALLALNLARSRGGWWIDLAAVAVFLAASLTLESGLLVAVVIVVAWATGARGVSRGAVAAVVVLFGLYMCGRFWYLGTGTPGLVDRSSGFMLEVLDPEQLIERFGDNPIVFYAYNVVASIMSVLFAEPQAGVFEFARAWTAGDVPPRHYVAVLSSAATTALIAWAVIARWRGRVAEPRAGDDQLLIIAAAVIVANAVLSFAYTKDEIVSVAGAFYGLAAFAAARYILLLDPPVRRRIGHAALCVTLFAVASLWAFRSVGLHHMLRVQAFKHRNDWASIEPQRYIGSDVAANDAAALLIRQLRAEALEMRVPNPELRGRWVNRWWGE
jgi:hypothetical protein